MKARLLAFGESMDFTCKHIDEKDAVFSVNSGRGFERKLEPRWKKENEGVTECQANVSQLGEREQ